MFYQAEDGIRDAQESRGLGDVYKRQEQGRARDEHSALQHGVLGQETTGFCGFSMALRSIPIILDYARLLQRVSPGAWMYNFTNPAGLVTQALLDAGYTRTIGICDGANACQAAVAAWAGVDAARIRTEVFGLNHLSWCRRAWLEGEDLLPAALADDHFLHDAQGLFEPQLVRLLGMHLNEYLYYYYYAGKAEKAIRTEGKTRGTEILELNNRLMDQLEEIGIRRNPERALRTYFGYEKRRGETYMHYAHGGTSIEEADRRQLFDADIPSQGGEGYAGVALSVIEALEKNRPLVTALNVPNGDSIQGMAAEDVVETSCLVDGSGVHPQPIGRVPMHQLGLMQSIKKYEHLTIEAIRQHSRNLAVEALMTHPLILSYSHARLLVDACLETHRDTIGEWSG